LLEIVKNTRELCRSYGILVAVIIYGDAADAMRSFDAEQTFASRVRCAGPGSLIDFTNQGFRVVSPISRFHRFRVGLRMLMETPDAFCVLTTDMVGSYHVLCNFNG